MGALWLTSDIAKGGGLCESLIVSICVNGLDEKKHVNWPNYVFYIVVALMFFYLILNYILVKYLAKQTH